MIEKINNKFESKEEGDLESFRFEIKEIQKQCFDEYARRGPVCKEKNLNILGAEILAVDPEKLTKEDMAIYKELAKYEDGEIGFDEIFRKAGEYRKNILEYHAKKIGQDWNYEFQKDSREQFLAWISAKILFWRTKKYRKEKEVNKKQRESGREERPSV